MQAITLTLRTILPAALLVGAAYNACLTVNGPDGLRATEALRVAAAAEREALIDKHERIARLTERADGLLMASLDEDLLEESLRARLGLVAEGELMVRMDDLDRLAAVETTRDALRVAALAERRER